SRPARSRSLRRAAASLSRTRTRCGEKLMSILRSVRLFLAFPFLFTLTACQADSAKSPAVKTEPPAKLAGAAVKEAELTSISLTEAAEKRLGIRIEEARAG